MGCRILTHTFVVLATTVATLAAANAAAQTPAQIQRDVNAALRGDADLRDIDVSVDGTEVLLRGQVPHLWAKTQAIEKALQVDGVVTVASELRILEGELDESIADRISDALLNYPYYTMWDHLDGRVLDGVVTITGSVTADRDKKRDIYERIAKIPGVQDVVDEIDVQTPSVADEQIRRQILRRVLATSDLDRLVSQRNPIFHIVVNRSIVTLYGFVPTRIEYLALQQIAMTAPGVLRVDNQLQILN